MRKWTKLSIVVVIVFIISSLSPSSSFAESPELPLEATKVESVFQTISAKESTNAIPNGTPGLGVNWIVNGDGELGMNSWEVGSDDFIVSELYGDTDMPTPIDPGPTIRGTHFFKSGGTHFEKNAWQTGGVGAAATMLATGKVRFTMSGYFGGKGTNDDRALLRVYFGYRESTPPYNCVGIGNAQIGPVTAADRGYQTGLLERTTSGLVPAGTECFTFQLQMYVQEDTAGTAYADNLSFVLDGIPIFIPMISQSASQPTNTIPTPPTNLVINQVNLTSLGLSWNDNSNNETGFLIQRAIGASTTYTELTRLGPGLTNYMDSGLTPATTYKYRVSAFNGKGTSTYASVTGATSSQPTSPPNHPLSCWTSDTGSTSTTLGWVDSADNEEYYILHIRLPGQAWVEIPQHVEANATYVFFVDLPEDETTWFGVSAHNAAGDSAVCQVEATTTSSSNILEIQNNSSYPIISLEVDGIDQFPVYPMGLMPGQYYELYLPTGYHDLTVTTGFWQNKTDRFFMYSYFVDFVMPSGGNLIWTIPDVSINDLLTQFSPDGQGYWEGYFFDAGANCHTAAFLFNEDGSYKFYFGNSQIDSGTYYLMERLPATFSVKFNVGAREGWLLETYGQFYMNNGPVGWNQITYVYKPQGYIYNQFCP